ncbi:hypothetical protein [Streptomyces nymphaeiformis]|uniref:DUF4209 domain-containing protein n=1 Tax=Streptomyces nymphaeiformis TaxID=2663842 RepID=A0A7W7U363_9ACTN|nr:hypothetical protein [Streptomyces nymphaeiformis]MBB4984159.1 hypothetical protein [Streptomyces nymphaeiformis]
MTMIDSATLAAFDAASQGFVFHFDISDKLGAASKDAAGGLDEEHVEALRTGFLFFLRDGTFVGQYVGGGPQPWPRELSQISSRTIDIWAAYAEVAEHPGARGHLHDLLHVVSSGRPKIEHLRAAVDSYVESADWFEAAPQVSGGRLLAARSLVRAFELALSVNLPAAADIAATMDARAMAEMDRGDEGPGVVGTLLNSLVKRSKWHGHALPIAERAAEHYRRDPHVRVSFLRDLAAVTKGDSGGVERINRAIASTYTDAAERLTGIAKLMMFTDAAVHARDKGLSDLHADIRMKQQALTREDLEFQKVRFDTGMPEELLDAAGAHIGEAKDLEDALRRIADYPPPPPAALATEGDEQGLQPSFFRLDTVRINTAGPVLVHNTGRQDSPGHDQRVIHLELTGVLIRYQLDVLWERFEPSIREMTTALTSPVVLPAERARLLARAFRLYWEYDEIALFVAVPLVEGILRRYLKRHIPVINLAKGEAAGGVGLLGGLLRSLDDKPDLAGSSWAGSFLLLLAEPDAGPNVRNTIAHDLWESFPPRHQTAMVLLAALVFLRAASAGSTGEAEG